MKTSKTLLRTPELVKAIRPLVSGPVTYKDIFRLLGTGDLVPLGYLRSVPLFDAAQITDIANTVDGDERSDRDSLLGGRL